MSSFYNAITEKNKLSLNKPTNSNIVYYSELKEWFTDNAFRSFCFKYVLEDCIHYKINNKEFNVHAGDFMIACKQPDVDAYFHSDRIVKSICIDIVPEIVSEAFTILAAKDYKLDDYMCGYFEHPNFYESVCHLKSAPALSVTLRTLVQNIQSGTADQLLNREWFLDLAEKIVYQEQGNYLALNGIYSVKLQTRKEVLHRLAIGKQYIDDCFLEIGTISEVAIVCCLSEFHFFRTFRQAYGVSPYKYLLRKRLEFAKSLFRTQHFTIEKVAIKCNFADLPTFSKAFKREFGITPSQWQAANVSSWMLQGQA